MKLDENVNRSTRRRGEGKRPEAQWRGGFLCRAAGGCLARQLSHADLSKNPLGGYVDQHVLRLFVATCRETAIQREEETQSMEENPAQIIFRYLTC
jgi:hypothetical protein